MIRLEFPGFSGTPQELREALRRGRISSRALPVLSIVEQALSQVPEDLRARSELLPILAELLVLKLSPERAFTPREEGEEAPLVRVLLDLSETVAFLEERLRRRARLLPVPPPPLPRPALRLPPKALAEAARPFRKAVLALGRERFGLMEAWARIKAFLRGRLPFHQLPLRTWEERAMGFAALLEAYRLGRVALEQEANFGPLWVEVARGGSGGLSEQGSGDPAAEAMDNGPEAFRGNLTKLAQ
ncbi:chromosome segregation protein ScpA [Thermus sp. NMX2.A1]|uniref:chromosome segregation protein ScpA n=1 Tax=Thermus sp. NMX2.A1 TaxID=570924 RepID=UPI0003DBEA2C|nr:chromosome segregation protein ScpA [Thermus sp. NMX2.A1]ETN88489.1 chromosome segregation protein ScpA [Thermus sp. NMX2.A1]